MRYYVVAEDGSKYGPAGVTLLNHWIEEGRLLPEMILEEDGSHHKVTAASVQELDFFERSEAPVAAPVKAAMSTTMVHEDSTTAILPEVTIAFAMAVLTVCLAPVSAAIGYLGVFTTLLGLMAALKAKDRSDALGGPAMIVNLLAFVVWLSAHVIFALR